MLLTCWLLRAPLSNETLLSIITAANTEVMASYILYIVLAAKLKSAVHIELCTANDSSYSKVTAKLVTYAACNCQPTGKFSTLHY